MRAYYIARRKHRAQRAQRAENTAGGEHRAHNTARGQSTARREHRAQRTLRADNAARREHCARQHTARREHRAAKHRARRIVGARRRPVALGTRVEPVPRPGVQPNARVLVVQSGPRDEFDVALHDDRSLSRGEVQRGVVAADPGRRMSSSLREGQGFQTPCWTAPLLTQRRGRSTVGGRTLLIRARRDRSAAFSATSAVRSGSS